MPARHPLETIADPRYWHQRPWYNIDNFPPEMIDYAKRLLDEESSLFQAIHENNLIVANAVSESIQASFAIEDEKLRLDSILSSLIASLRLDVVTGIIPTDDTEREANAVRMTTSLLNGGALTLDSILKAHGTLSYNYGYGRFRIDGEDIVVANTRSGERYFNGAPPHKLGPLMQDFMDWWEAERPEMPSPLGSLAAHYIFVCIHPFVDGNGRMARALGEKALAQDSKSVFRPYSIAAMILKNRPDYYRSISSSDPMEFPRFMLRMHGGAIKEGLRRADRHLLLEEILVRAEFSKYETNVLKLAALNEDFVISRERCANLENGQEVWDDLQAKGVLDVTGAVVQGWKPPVKAEADASEEEDFGVEP